MNRSELAAGGTRWGANTIRWMPDDDRSVDWARSKSIDPSAIPVLEHVVDELHGTLRPDLLGLFLYGSTVSGGFDPGVSDVDLLAVTEREVEVLDLNALDRVHRTLGAAHPEWLDRLEIVYVGRSTLASFRSDAGALAVISPGEPFHITGPPSDWTANWYLVREHGVTLTGAPANELIPPISRDEFLGAIRRYVTYLLHQDLAALRPGALAYSLLSMCRALMTLETGAGVSKQEAAAWARVRMPDRAALIDEAVACRLSRGAVGFEDDLSRSSAVQLIRTIGTEIAG
jgi:hypothetical protein